jgi:hypothetical protein
MKEKTHAISSDIRRAVCGVMYPRFWSSKHVSEHITCSKCCKKLNISKTKDQAKFNL